MCIYCMTPLPDNELTKEHIIPLALNGTLTFRNAVCETCRDYTNKAFENVSLQADFLIPRLLLELKRRQKGTKPFPPAAVVTANDEAIEELILELADYPPVASFYTFDPAGALVEIDRGEGLEFIRLVFVKFPSPNYPSGLKQVEVTHKGVWSAYALSLAKMAYCYAVAEKGIGSFDGQGIRDLLLGKRTDILNFVGGPLDNDPVAKGHLHRLRMNTRGDSVSVTINLFASYSAVRNEVFVGKAIR